MVLLLHKTGQVGTTSIILKEQTSVVEYESKDICRTRARNSLAWQPTQHYCRCEQIQTSYSNHSCWSYCKRTTLLTGWSLAFPARVCSRISPTNDVCSASLTHISRQNWSNPKRWRFNPTSVLGIRGFPPDHTRYELFTNKKGSLFFVPINLIFTVLTTEMRDEITIHSLTTVFKRI